jgi:ATP-binding cassette subfamily B protein/subfamily B ATP-binding cassette protein MsbA
MFKPSRKIVSEWYKVGKVLASVDRIADLLDLEPAVQDEYYALPAPPLHGRLAFEGVAFAYHAEPGDDAPRVLEDVSFEVRPGEVVALVGRSGAGKSTIAQLVPRLYDPDRGTVRLDGVDLRGYTLESLRSQVSLVLQDTVLLTGTIAENIAYGVEDATREQIEHAARCANAHDFISAMAKGYDTEVGERGSTLSGGQRQRIAIARAFIRAAPLLVLDEPTTGLDADSTRLVVEALRTLMLGTTTLIISHDPGLVRCADRVLVVDGGRIAEDGTPDQLSVAGGTYRDLMGAGPDDDEIDVREDGGPVGAASEDEHSVGEIIHRLKVEGSASVRPGRPHEHVRHGAARRPDGAPAEQPDGTPAPKLNGTPQPRPDGALVPRPKGELLPQATATPAALVAATVEGTG